MMAAYQNNHHYSLNQLVNIALDKVIANVEVDSIGDVVDKIEQQQLFIIKQGERFNPLAKIDVILQSKPSVILCQKDNPLLNDINLQKIKKSSVALVLVDDITEATVYALQQFYQVPLQQLTLVGVTGTDGKSSVAMLFAMMQAKTTGVIGTLGYGTVNNLTYTGMTTPTIVHLYAMLAQLQQQGCTTVVMEVSSHAIHQQRIAGLNFAVAAITNLGRDHLDYHGTIGHYHQCKLGFLASQQVLKIVVNIDDENLKALAPNAKGVSLSKLNNLNIAKVGYSEKGLLLHFANKQGVDEKGALKANSIAVNLYGQFNVYNLLTVIAMYQQLGFDAPAIETMLTNVQAVEGRMQLINDQKGRYVFVDFAHTPNGLKNALQAVAQHFTSRIVVVFGCGGDRDKGKRPEMGRIAEHYANTVIITNDNPRSEQPSAIVADIKQGLSQPDKAMVIEDRYQAIQQGLSICKQGEVLLVAGKGHETTQTDSDGAKPFHDATVIKNLLRGGA